jgi:hypothetical protein
VKAGNDWLIAWSASGTSSRKFAEFSKTTLAAHNSAHLLWSGFYSSWDGLRCADRNRELGKLAEDLNKASKQGRLAAFFNGTEGLSSIHTHTTTLDSLVEDLTVGALVVVSEVLR